MKFLLGYNMKIVIFLGGLTFMGEVKICWGGGGGVGDEFSANRSGLLPSPQ